MTTQYKAILKKILDVSPNTIIRKIKQRKNKFIISKKVDFPIPIMSSIYFEKQHNLLIEIFNKLAQGEKLVNVLLDKKTILFGERIVEYTYLYQWLSENKDKLDILDIGCVLNNKIVTEILRKRCKDVWFCNPAVENITWISNPSYYHISTLSDSFPTGHRFPIVTCLSTIEHIGYDNNQYGLSETGTYTEPNIAPFKEAFSKLAKLTSSKGKLLISFPYGYREVLTHPKTAKISSQVMDYNSVMECIPYLEKEDFIVNFKVFQVVDMGWKEVDPKICKVRYADRTPGASAVAILDCKKI